MNGELRSLYIDSNFAKKDANNRYQYDLVGGVAVPENSRVYVDNISFTNTFSEKVDDNSDELYVKTRKHKDLRDPSGVGFSWTYNGVLADHLFAGTYAIEQHYYYADLTATTWATPAGDPKAITRVSGDKYTYVNGNGQTEKLFVKYVHPSTFGVDVQLNGSANTGTYFNGVLMLGSYQLNAATPANVIKTSTNREPVRDMTGTWTFQDNNTIALSSTIAQNEFSFTSQGMSGVIKLLHTKHNGARLVYFYRQSGDPSDATFDPYLIDGDMLVETDCSIRFGNHVVLTPPAVAPVLNLAKMVLTPQYNVNLDGDWVRSAGSQETLHIRNNTMYGMPGFLRPPPVQVSEAGATEAIMAMQKDDDYTPSFYCHGVLNYANRTIVWQGAINETWTYQGTTAQLFSTDNTAQHYEMKNYHDVKFASSDGGDGTVNSTLFAIDGPSGGFSYVTQSASVNVIIQFQPADEFPYTAYRTDTGALAATFRIEDKKVTLLGTPNGPYGALYAGPNDSDTQIIFPIGNTKISSVAQSVTMAAATGGQSLVFSTNFEMARVSNFGTAQATGMTLGAPLNGTFSLNPTDESISLTATWLSSGAGQVSGGNTITYANGLVLTGTMPTTSVGGTETTVTVHLAPGRYTNMTQFAAAVTTALDGVFPGSTVTANVSGTNLEISSDNGSTNAVEQLCLLTDEQMKGTGELKSGNRWLSNTDGTKSVATTFTVGPVVLPRTVNSAYLVSDTLAGFRDTMGPVPNQRGTIAKISLGNTAPGDFHNESLYRPHLYSTLPSKDVTRVDFALTDSRGIALDLLDSNLAFVVTFSNDHLMV